MKNYCNQSPLYAFKAIVALLLTFFVVPILGYAEESGVRAFDVPAGSAAKTLRLFAEQSGQQVVFMEDSVKDENTKAIKGKFIARKALDLMLSGTNLIAEQDKSDALAVRRVQPPARTSAPVEVDKKPTRQSNTSSPRPDYSSDAVALSAFEVNSNKDRGYRRTNSITTSRIGIAISDVPQAIQVIPSELLDDMSINRTDDVFLYSSSVVSHKNEVRQANQFQMRGFSMPRYLNGMQLAGGNGTPASPYSDNIERVEIAKGAVGLFYGNSSPNGVANYITKRPQFINRTTLLIAGGSYDYARTVLDTQAVLIPRLALAYRLITAAGKQDSRINSQYSDYNFIAPSFTIQPTSTLKAEVEYNFTRFRQPYQTATASWTGAINPEYEKDINNPSSEILNYFKTRYNLATDALARAKLQERWITPAWNVFNINWQSDKLAITGTEPFFNKGSKVDWWRFSNEGDRWLGANPDSNTDGRTYSIDASITEAPTDNLVFKYHWLHQETKQNFLRGTYAMNGGLRPDGRVLTLAQALTTYTLDEKEQGISDAQQLDASYQAMFFGIKHAFTAGVEERRLRTSSGSAATNAALLASDSYRRRDPFAQPTPPSLYTVVTGPTVTTTGNVAKYRDYYLSYRGAALNGKLHGLFGYRKVKSLDLSRSNDTLTYGAVYEALPGIHLFASRSNTFIITNAFNITGGGVLPSDKQVRLDDETGKGWEAGFKSSLLDDKLSGTISLFDVERTGIVGNSSSGNATDPRNQDSNPSNDVRFSNNGGVQLSRGLDVDLVWTPNDHFQAVFNFVDMWTAQVISDPSIDMKVRSRAYIRAFERRLTKAPNYSSAVVLKYNFTADRLKGLSVGGAVRYSGEYEVVNTPNFDVMVPEETIFDAFATYDRIKLWSVPATLQVNIKNITNQINDITRGNGLELTGSVKLRF